MRERDAVSIEDRRTTITGGEMRRLWNWIFRRRWSKRPYKSGWRFAFVMAVGIAIFITGAILIFRAGWYGWRVPRWIVAAWAVGPPFWAIVESAILFDNQDDDEAVALFDRWRDLWVQVWLGIGVALAAFMIQ